MNIRPVQIQDANAMSLLIKSLSHFFTAHPQGLGAETFLQSVEPNAIEAKITDASFSYFVGFSGSQLAGLIALRNKSHLYHLFVATSFQGQGLSRQLWNYALKATSTEENTTTFTVNSSIYAQAVYEKLGFIAQGVATETKGIVFIPMTLEPN
jgi:ribosomal protein S18 acetylase RimI-like enzyme